MTKIITTDDGSCSLFDPARELHYRSHMGALAESTHVYLEGTGIVHRPPPWRVLELGFGGGFNFLNTAEHFLLRFAGGAEPAALYYEAIELTLIPPALLDDPAYDTWSPRSRLRELVQDALDAGSTTTARHITRTYEEGACQLHLTLCQAPWQATTPLTSQAMAYYHDPFGPNDDPPSWERACFAWALPYLAPDGVLATYAAASRVRKAMVQAGWHVAKAPGSGRKREMTLAAPTPAPLTGYKLIPRAKYLTEDQADAP